MNERGKLFQLNFAGARAIASGSTMDEAAVARTLAGVLKTYGRDRLELEFRLGQRSGGKFVPGVSEDGWQRLKDQLDASSAMTCEASTTRELIPGNDGAKYVVPCAPPGADQPAKPFWMHKKRLQDIDGDTRHAPWSCRASMSLEVVDRPAARQAPQDCKFERHKQRWSYTYKCWSIDLTRVMSNLPHQLDNDAVSFEVEIELVDTSEFFARPMEDIVRWGLRLVDDMCRMLAPPDDV